MPVHKALYINQSIFGGDSNDFLEFYGSQQLMPYFIFINKFSENF